MWLRYVACADGRAVYSGGLSSQGGLWNIVTLTSTILAAIYQDEVMNLTRTLSS